MKITKPTIFIGLLIFCATAWAHDFNGDGYDDLAVGTPFDQVDGKDFAGSVDLTFGGAQGITATNAIHITRQSLQSKVKTKDLFGGNLTWGDFDGDGLADLAISAVGVPVGSYEGEVTVIYGSSVGLGKIQNWNAKSNGLNKYKKIASLFGGALTSGDYNGDGYADLAIADPNSKVNKNSYAGAVLVLYGSNKGLSSKGSQIWHKNISGVPDKAGKLEYFGRRLMSGDFNGDGRSDLAIQSYESKGDTYTEMEIYALFGSKKGLKTKGVQLFLPPISGNNLNGEMQAGDFNGDGFDDLAVAELVPIGGPGGIVPGIHFDAVVVFAGGALGLSGSPIQSIPVAQVSTSASGSIYRLGAGDIDGDGIKELLLGNPYYSADLNGGIFYSGAIYVFFDPILDPLNVAIVDVTNPQSESNLGTSIAVGNFDSVVGADIAAGVPGLSVDGKTSAGAVSLFKRAEATVEFPVGFKFDHFIFQKDIVAGSSDEGDNFGRIMGR